MKKSLLLILALVFIAGCIGQRSVKVEANNGLKIMEFSADPPVAEFNDNVLFTVGIENVGGTTAKNVDVQLFGLKGIWKELGGKEVETAGKIFDNDPFDPPLPAQNRPGDLKFFTKTVLPPELLEGVEQDFPVTAHVTFDYSTTGSIIIPTISKSLFRIKTDKGEAVDSTPKISNSDGPLKISLSKGTVPIVVDERRGGHQDATFVIEFLNIGDGFPVTEKSVTVNGQPRKILGILTGSITVSGKGVFFDPQDSCLSISRTSSDTKVDFTTANIDLLKLRSDGRLPLSCTLKIDRGQFTPTTSGIITFSINMNYKYFIEKTINIHVFGKEEPATKTQEEIKLQKQRENSCQSIKNCVSCIQNSLCGWNKKDGICKSWGLPESRKPTESEDGNIRGDNWVTDSEKCLAVATPTPTPTPTST